MGGSLSYKKQNRNRLIETENRLTAFKGGWLKKVNKEINKNKLIDTDNSMVITRGKGVWGEVGRG